MDHEGCADTHLPLNDYVKLYVNQFITYTNITNYYIFRMWSQFLGI